MFVTRWVGISAGMSAGMTSKSRQWFNLTVEDRKLADVQSVRVWLSDCERLLERAITQQGLSARAHDRILKVARTIADVDGCAAIETKHLAEAVQYRTLDRTYWA